MPDDADHNSSDRPAQPPTSPAEPGGRRWLGILFDCCRVYSRIYRNGDGTAYVGRCPRCYRELRVPIGPGGSSGRFYRAE